MVGCLFVFIINSNSNRETNNNDTLEPYILSNTENVKTQKYKHNCVIERIC